MNRILFIISVMASGSAFAIPSFQTFGGKAIEQSVARRAPKPAPTECTSFAGTWTGSCQIGDKKTPEETVTIKQNGCLSVQIGGETSNIGALRNFSEAGQTEKGDAYGAAAALVTEWNDKHTELSSYFNALVKAVGDDKHFNFEGTGVTRIEGGRLLVDMALLGQKISCVYDKK